MIKSSCGLPPTALARSCRGCRSSPGPQLVTAEQSPSGWCPASSPPAPVASVPSPGDAHHTKQSSARDSAPGGHAAGCQRRSGGSQRLACSEALIKISLWICLKCLSPDCYVLQAPCCTPRERSLHKLPHPRPPLCSNTPSPGPSLLLYRSQPSKFINVN